MYWSKLGQLYRSLKPSEIRQLKAWINSPFHNQNQDVIGLFEFLFSRRAVSEVSYQKERAFAYLYPDKTYNDLRMRHLLSLAYDVLIAFVRYNLSVSISSENDILLAADLHKRNLHAPSKAVLAQSRLVLQENPLRSDRYYLNAFRIESEQMEQSGAKERIGSNNLLQITQNLDYFFILNTLKNACVYLSQRNLRQIDIEIPFLEAILTELRKGRCSDSPAILTYYAIYNALLYPEQETHFEQLKYYILNYKSIFPTEEYKGILLQTINYCIRRLNSGATHYITQAFEMYQYGLANKVLLDENQQFSPFAYKNIVAIGLRLQAYEWVADFIETYATYLPPQQRITYHDYNLARWHFAQGNYKAAMKLLSQLEFDDLFMSLDTKVMQLKMHYEEQNYEVLESLLQSFSTLLRRKTIMGYHKDHYKKIIFFTRKLLALAPSDTVAKKRLAKQINETNPLPEKPWLLKQLGETL